MEPRLYINDHAAHSVKCFFACNETLKPNDIELIDMHNSKINNMIISHEQNTFNWQRNTETESRFTHNLFPSDKRDNMTNDSDFNYDCWLCAACYKWL